MICQVAAGPSNSGILVPLEYSITWLACVSPACVACYWLACRELLKVVYVLVCHVLSLAALAFRGYLAKEPSCWYCGMVRHQALLNRVGMEGLYLQSVAVG